MHLPLNFFLPLFVAAASLCASEAPAPSVGACPAEREGKEIVFRSNGRPVARYQAEPGKLPRADIPAEYARGGYVRELLTPAGRVVTDDYAVGHIHHHGVWTAWTKTQFQGRSPDFWNMGQKKGRVDFLSATVSGGALRAEHQAVDMLAQPECVALRETWSLGVSAWTQPMAATALTLESVWTAATPDPVKLPQYHYGGLGIRGRAEWNGAGNLRSLASNGETDRLKINTLRAKWCWIGGLVDGKLAGIAILDHPGNYRHPQPIRLHPAEPFFCYAPQQAGPMELAPGQPYKSRFQILAIDGEPDAAALEAAWQAWSKQ